LTASQSGYGALMRVPGFALLYASLLISRISGQMVNVTIILFVLARFHSPQLAGLTAFLAVTPGLIVSPIAGALLDRFGRARLVTLDNVIAAATSILVATLSWRHALAAPVLLAIVFVSSLTSPLSNSGARSLFPIIAPRPMWERANALDSSGHVIATLLGAPLAGAVVGFAGPEWALTATGAGYLCAGALMTQVQDPTSRVPRPSILVEAWQGLVYVVRNASLRGVALTVSTFNLGWGVLNIALPVLVLGRLHQGPAAVGLLWGAMGGAGLVSALAVGRLDTRGRERQLMTAAIVASAAGLGYRWRVRSRPRSWPSPSSASPTARSTSRCSPCASGALIPRGSAAPSPSRCRSTGYANRFGPRRTCDRVVARRGAVGGRRGHAGVSAVPGPGHPGQGRVS
jgi:MFS family permease